MHRRSMVRPSERTAAATHDWLGSSGCNWEAPVARIALGERPPLAQERRHRTARPWCQRAVSDRTLAAGRTRGATRSDGEEPEMNARRAAGIALPGVAAAVALA